MVQRGIFSLIVALIALTWLTTSPPEENQKVVSNSFQSPANNPTKDHLLAESHTKNQPQNRQHYEKDKFRNNHYPSILSENFNPSAELKAIPNPVSENVHSPVYNNVNNEKHNETSVSQGYFISNQIIDDNYNPTETLLNAHSSVTKTKSQNDLLTIESISNTYKSPIKNKKIKWQLVLTPTISYRRLTENKSFLHNIAFASGYANYASLYNVNSMVTHKPDMGFQLGVLAGYPLTRNLKIRTGMQFNINRYGIKAYSYRNEIATIAFNSNRGDIDSLATATQYRNFNGYKSNWLQNFYFSVSAPVGAELNIGGINKTKFGIAATIQPTYIISDKAFLISTDYKNYVEVPWLVRKWNVNTGLEIFANYSIGKTQWQVGPQFRYQLLSSFQNKYPVKENLFDFGFKVGIMLNK